MKKIEFAEEIINTLLKKKIFVEKSIIPVLFSIEKMDLWNDYYKEKIFIHQLTSKIEKLNQIGLFFSNPNLSDGDLLNLHNLILEAIRTKMIPDIQSEEDFKEFFGVFYNYEKSKNVNIHEMKNLLIELETRYKYIGEISEFYDFNSSVLMETVSDNRLPEYEEEITSKETLVFYKDFLKELSNQSFSDNKYECLCNFLLTENTECLKEYPDLEKFIEKRYFLMKEEYLPDVSVNKGFSK